MTHKILLVDDEPLVLDSLRRELAFRFTIDTAPNGFEALRKIQAGDTFAVVVSDFRMPRMDGAQLLARVAELAPETIRIMLTGNADLQTAVEAINEGHIFRFLVKPCSGDQLIRSIEAGLRQHQLVIAEKSLLENTLTETANMLTEVLTIVNPRAYGRAMRIQELVAHLVKQLNIKDGWQYEMAASLSQLGWIIFPPQMLDKLISNKALTPTEQAIFDRHPITAGKLLEKIPRLELVARMIAGQERPIDQLNLDPGQGDAYAVDFGSHMLKICVEYDRLLLQGMMHDRILAHLFEDRVNYRPEILQSLDVLRSYTAPPEEHTIEEITLDQLDTNMILVEPVMDNYGNTIFEAETRVTRPVLVQLYRMDVRGKTFVQPFKITRI